MGSLEDKAPLWGAERQGRVSCGAAEGSCLRFCAARHVPHSHCKILPKPWPSNATLIRSGAAALPSQHYMVGSTTLPPSLAVQAARCQPWGAAAAPPAPRQLHLPATCPAWAQVRGDGAGVPLVPGVGWRAAWQGSLEGGGAGIALPSAGTEAWAALFSRSPPREARLETLPRHPEGDDPLPAEGRERRDRPRSGPPGAGGTGEAADMLPSCWERGKATVLLSPSPGPEWRSSSHGCSTSWRQSPAAAWWRLTSKPHYLVAPGCGGRCLRLALTRPVTCRRSISRGRRWQKRS